MSESNSQEYISHHLHFLQVDLRDLSVVDSVKPNDQQAYQACLVNSDASNCIKTVSTQKCYLSDLGQGTCVGVLPEAKSSNIFNPYTVNLDSLYWEFCFWYCSVMHPNVPRAVYPVNSNVLSK